MIVVNKRIVHAAYSMEDNLARQAAHLPVRQFEGTIQHLQQDGGSPSFLLVFFLHQRFHFVLNFDLLA